MAENIVFNGSDFMATAGQTNRLTLADARTSLRGKLVAPERLDWGGYLGRLTAYPAQGGQPTQVFFTLQSQGRFRVVDLPESVAKLELALYRPPIPVGVGKIGPDILAKASGAANAQDGPQQFNLQDLGPIEVDLAVPVGVGDPAPELSLKTPAGRPVTLADFRGKYVLVDFSTRWCGARQGSEPFLAQAHKEHGRGGRLLVLEANLDADPEAARHYLTGRRVPWMQSTAGDWADAMGLSRFGAAGLPSAFLIGPDGKVLARDLYGSGILKAVNQHLGRK
jgi:thiol-disulfide isomerase/thioredoxin